MALLGWLVLGLALLWFFRPQQQAAKGAEKLKTLIRDTHQPRQEYAEVDLGRFPHLDQRFYESIRSEAEALGFVFIGDLENRTANGLGLMKPTVIRQLTDRNGITVGAYNYQGIGLASWLMPGMRSTRTIDLETEFSDGTYVGTSNAWSARHLERPPEIFMTFRTMETGLRALLDEHRRRLKAHIDQRPDRTVREVLSLDDAIESNHRMNALKAAFQAARQHRLTRDELRGLAKDNWAPGTGQAADDVADVLEQPTGGSASTLEPTTTSTVARNVLLWIALVVFFVAFYTLTGR